MINFHLNAKNVMNMGTIQEVAKRKKRSNKNKGREENNNHIKKIEAQLNNCTSIQDNHIRLGIKGKDQPAARKLILEA